MTVEQTVSPVFFPKIYYHIPIGDVLTGKRKRVDNITSSHGIFFLIFTGTENGGSFKQKMAELPKDKHVVSLFFLFKQIRDCME